MYFDSFAFLIGNKRFQIGRCEPKKTVIYLVLNFAIGFVLEIIMLQSKDGTTVINKYMARTKPIERNDTGGKS